MRISALPVQLVPGTLWIHQLTKRKYRLRRIACAPCCVQQTHQQAMPSQSSVLRPAGGKPVWAQMARPASETALSGSGMLCRRPTHQCHSLPKWVLRHPLHHGVSRSTYPPPPSRCSTYALPQAAVADLRLLHVQCSLCNHSPMCLLTSRPLCRASRPSSSALHPAYRIIQTPWAMPLLLGPALAIGTGLVWRTPSHQLLSSCKPYDMWLGCRLR
jgi:hypothetical protein